MLPVVKRKTLEVPHGLAAIAAAICLVLAFATDLSDRDAQRMVEVENAKATEFVISQAPAASDDSVVVADGNRAPSTDATASAGNSGALITWFGLLR